MLKVLTPRQMYAAEADYFREGSELSISLMERAAGEFVRALERRFASLHGLRVCVACGPGNNGGDGYAIARRLHEAQAEVTAMRTCPERIERGDAAEELRRARVAGVPILDSAEGLKRPNLWVDAIFGIGFTRALDDRMRELIARMASDRAAGAFVAAVDLPTGIDGQTGGTAPGEGGRQSVAVEADLTVSFQWLKAGHLLQAGPDFCGEVTVCDIGIGDKHLPADHALLVEPSDCKPMLPVRRRNTHKGDYGHMLLVAGSLGMAGAARIAAEAALRAGAGLVTVACPASIVPILQISVPCAMCLPLPERDGALSEEAVEPLVRALTGKTALAVGPGLSLRASQAILTPLLESALPAVVDADALNLIARGRLKLLKHNHVITPHPGEAARLLGRPIVDPIQDAKELSASGPVALLKGACTVVAGKAVRLIHSGTPGMARGGSGDALTGILGAFLARCDEPERAAWTAAEVHGLAGSEAARRFTEIGMTPLDLIACLPDTIRFIQST